MNTSRTLGAVLIGLLSSILRRYCLKDSPSTIREESLIGWLTWVLLYTSCLCVSYRSQPAAGLSNATPRPYERLWSGQLTVAGLSASVITGHFARNRGIFPPANPVVTLASLLAAVAIPTHKDTLHQLEAAQGRSDQGFQERSPLNRPISPLRVTPRVPVNILLVLLLAASVSYPNHLVSGTAATNLLFVAAQTVIFSLLSQLTYKTQSPSLTLHSLLDWDLLQRLSLPLTVCFTCLLIYSIPTSSLPNLLTLSRAVIESASWISLFILCSEKQSTTATAFETVATSFDVVTSHDGGLKLFSASISCIVSLWQSVTDVPPSQKYRNCLYLLISIPLFNLSHSKLYDLVGSKQKGLIMGMHPVESIVQDARREFSDLLSAQSRTVEQASREYTRRYGRMPPPNFEKWFDLARQHDFALVDEFDSMMRTFDPFWAVSPSVLQRLVTNIHERFSAFVVKYEVLGGRIATTGGLEASWFAESMHQLLPAEWAAHLPNMTLAVNIFDEPTVCIPRDTLDTALKPVISKDLDLSDLSDINELASGNPPRFLNIGKQDAWEAMALSCPVDSPARNLFCRPFVPETGPYFIRNLTKSRDICEHCELQNLEGFLMAPETLRLTHSLAPIWSQGKPSSFNDIIFPSPYYLVRGSDYVEAEDPDWGGKASQLYWVGAATGGHTTESNWKQMQRQRMVLMTQTGSTTPIQLLRETEPGIWRPYSTNMSDVSSLFSTRIMGVTPQCEYTACEAQKQAFGIGNQEVKDPASAAYAYKFALDLDGNSFSGRFYRLLQSKSMVIKQAVFEEWHDDRLIPWIHYVPLSTGFQELPELLRFLATTESGDEIASRIARESRDWAGKALRQVDLQLVWLRMLLEYGRIIDQK